ncbi:hypothetical protein GS885_02460 [Rhodococcus hoagii]|nr:hypothetical protein [Prescottella equi]
MSQCAQQILVRHAAGETRYDTTSFTVDDKSGVLLVWVAADRKQALAAFNSEFWLAVDFVDREVGDG